MSTTPESFCVRCKNYLKNIDEGPRMIKKCTACGSVYDLNDWDTLIYEATGLSTQSTLFDSVIQHSAHDPTNLKIDRPCPKCDRPVRTLTLVGDKMSPTISCKCGLIENIGHE